MELNKLYKIAENENINIINFKMENKAIIGCINNYYCIGVNYSKLSNSSDEKTLLAEELGHYYCNSLYNSNSSNEEISKKEFKATKWAIKTLIPFNKLKQLYYNGCRYKYEFAEELGVTEELLDKAYDYYLAGNYMQKKR